jgi:anti-sigma B factor antagonist
MSDQIPQPFMCKVEEDRARTIVRLSGDLDIVSADKCLERFEAIQRNRVGELVVDLRGLTFLDSMGLSALLTAHGVGAESGSSVSFIRGNRTVHRVFQITDTETRLRWANPVDLDMSEPR